MKSFWELARLENEGGAGGVPGQPTVPAQTDQPTPIVPGQEPAAAEPAAAPATPPAPAPEPPKRPWYEARIDTLTGRNKTLEERNAELELELERLRTGGTAEPVAPAVQPAGTPPAPPARPAPATVPVDAVQREAARLVAINEFNRKSNEVAAKGREKFTGKDNTPSFDQALAELNKLGGLSQDMIAAVLETESPAEIIHHLGTHLDEAATILASGMNSVQQALALDRLGRKLATPAAPQVSRAPAPLEPTAPGNGSERDPASMPFDEWLKWRNKELGIPAA